MVVLVVSWVAHEGQEHETARLLAALSTESRREAGCILFVAHRHESETRRFLVYEQYVDAEALASHRSTPHFLTIVKQHLPAVATRVEGHLYTPLPS
jgi:(4S)-4-hydroxy-5-phosphonooxypentane-2,3-dione isomerase